MMHVSSLFVPFIFYKAHGQVHAVSDQYLFFLSCSKKTCSSDAMQQYSTVCTTTKSHCWRRAFIYFHATDIDELYFFLGSHAGLSQIQIQILIQSALLA